MKNEIIQKIKDNKLIVILRGIQKDQLLPLCQALYDGGVRIVEFTFDQTKKITDDETIGNIRKVREYFKGEVLVGAGTVLTISQVQLAKNAGSEFIVSPNVNKDVIEETNKLSMVSIPGALTPTEIENAHLYGADIVKLFPAGDMGPNYIKSIITPLSHIDLLLTAGIGLHNIKDYKNFKVAGYGVSSNILNKTMLNNNDFDGIKELAKKFIEEIR